MNIRTVFLAAVAASVFAISSANAEPFGGTRYIYSAPTGSDQARQPFVTTVEHFNERGQDYIADAPTGSAAQKPVISLRNAASQGWNS